jgi:hypothetical protein
MHFFGRRKTDQQKSGASVFSARAPEPAAIVATLDDGSKLRHFFSSINREVARLFSSSVAPAGGNQADEKRAIVETFGVAIPTHFLTDSQQRSDT